MRITCSPRLAAIALLAGTGLLGPALPASAATPVETGCPAGYETLSVTDLEQSSPNYHLPRQLDEAGNQDGYVCGRAATDQQAENFCGGPCSVPVLYDFQENDRTPAHKA
jgi:hypothetical protein